MKRFRLWLALKILGGRIDLSKLVDETYADIWPKHTMDESNTRRTLTHALYHAFTMGCDPNCRDFKRRGL